MSERAPLSVPLSGQVLGSGNAGDLERVNYRFCLQVGKKEGGFLSNSQTGPKEDAVWGPCLSFIFVSQRSALKEAWVTFLVL